MSPFSVVTVGVAPCVAMMSTLGLPLSVGVAVLQNCFACDNWFFICFFIFVNKDFRQRLSGRHALCASACVPGSRGAACAGALSVSASR